LLGLLTDRPLMAVQEMLLRIGRQIHYADVVMANAPLDQATRTLIDALTVFEVLLDANQAVSGLPART
jgi:hypothetical protein